MSDKTMRAVVITRPGGEVLMERDVPVPQPGRQELLISVRAAAVNRLDLLQRHGLYPAPPGCPQDIPGVEYAGLVESAGQNAGRFQKGDRVFGLVGGGSYAQYVVADERTVMPVPEGLSFIDAAAVPEAFITAFDAMVLQAGLGAGQTVLINAVGSGVGTAAAAVAREFGARAIGTARSAHKIKAACAAGLEDGIVVEGGKFAQAVLDLTDGRGVDVALELAGGQYVAEDMASMAPKGRIVVVGLLAGAACRIDLGILLRKRLQLSGTVLRSRSIDEKIAVTLEFSRQVLPLIAAGKLKAVVDKVFPLACARQAHEYVAANKNFGKVVLDASGLA